MGFFFKRSMTANSTVRGQMGPKYKIIRDFIVVLLKTEEDPIKNEGARVLTRFPPLKPYGSYRLPWKPEIRSDLAQNLMQPFPHPNNASDNI